MGKEIICIWLKQVSVLFVSKKMPTFAPMNPTNLWSQGQVSGYCFLQALVKGTKLL